MEELWTPWRMNYIKSTKSVTECIFCNLPSRQDHHHYILERDEHTFTILNLYPYAVGHLMVIPFAHHPRLGSLTESESDAMICQLARAEQILEAAYRPSRIQVGINLDQSAGAGVLHHLHTHLVPRLTHLTPATVSMDDTYSLLLPKFQEPRA